MKIKLSRKEVATAVLHNMETSYTGCDPIGIFAWPPSENVKYQMVQRGTEYRGTEIYDPEDFVEIRLDDDPWMWRAEARDELAKEGRIRDVPMDELTKEEEDLVDEYADGYQKVWIEELRYLDRVEFEDIEGDVTNILDVEWAD
jgi:hypothetical protein